MSLAHLDDWLCQDVRHAARTLAKQPVFALSIIATLALGIGANTAMFTMVSAVLLRPLPYPDPDSLVRVAGGATFARYDALRTAGSLAAVSAFNSFTADVTLASGNELLESVKAVRVSANLLPVLGVRPRLAALGKCRPTQSIEM